MKVGIVLHPYGEKRQSGLGRYALEMTQNIVEGDKNNSYIIFLKQAPGNLPEFSGTNWTINIIGKKFLWLDRGLYGTKLDTCVFFTPVMPFFVNFRKTIIVIHDLGYKYIKPKKILRKVVNLIMHFIYTFSIHKSSKIISVSKTTKKDILKNFNIQESKVSVVYNGSNNICFLEEEEVDLPDNFFLFVGVVKPRKNISNLVKAFAEFKEVDTQNFKLVIAGSVNDEYHEKISIFLKDKNIDKDVVFLGYVKDEKLSYMYKRAYTLVYPSLAEGFGMTVLEALSCGTPTIISNIDVFKEIFSDVAIFVDPNNTKSIGEAMIDISTDNDLRDNLSKRSKIFSEQFRWEKSAKEFINIINA